MNDDHLSKEETKRRAEAALSKMLSTPHKPHAPLKKKQGSPAKATRKPRKSTDSRG